jgi:molybdopterin/thiamine biosynthesis adenylyltransferase
MNNIFDYKLAFSRNIGLVSEAEQKKIGEFVVAIPGMGGVGGSHIISLVRQGFQNFKIADFDYFSTENFNRQYGAKINSVGRAKAEVMKEEALSINPDCKIEIFENGVNEDNIDEFLSSVDLVIDSLDAFAISARRLLINDCVKNKIPVITAGPIGFSTAFLIFMPGGPTFDEFFAINDQQTEDEQLLSFFVGLVPSLLQRKYMKNTSLKERKGPSSIGSVNLCSGVATIYALKILLNKGSVKAVPYYHQFDVMREKYVTKKLWFGNRNPIQKIKMKLADLIVKDSA